MEYEIISYNADQVAERRISIGFPFETVKRDAIVSVDDGRFDRVEIFDHGNQLIFHYPRITGPAV